MRYQGSNITLLLLLSHFSRVRLCATPQMAAHQAPVPGILQARTLEWALLLLLLLSRFSRVRLCATPQMAAHQAPVPGILQVRILEWVAISFFNA